MTRTFLLLPVTLALATLPASGQVVINEVSASNLTDYADNFGEFGDYVELYNTTAAAVDISGWYLSDSQSNPLKWAVPAGTIVPVNGRMLFMCSGRNTS